MIVIRRIHVMYRLKAEDVHGDTIERVHDFHAEKCPVYRSICGSIDITTDYELES